MPVAAEVAALAESAETAPVMAEAVAVVMPHGAVTVACMVAAAAGDMLPTAAVVLAAAGAFSTMAGAEPVEPIPEPQAETAW